MNLIKDNKNLPLLLFPMLFAATGLELFGFQMKVFLLVFGILLFFIAFINTDFALIILIFSMLLSPEFELGGIPGRAIVVRFDDIFLFIVFFGWLAKMAVNKELGLLKTTSLNLPILIYIAVLILSSAIGMLRGNIMLKSAFFYILKYVEYFILFFMVSNHIHSRQQIKKFIIAFLITCVFTCAYALITVGGVGRATAPFEGPHAEPNTLGGYLLILFALNAGFFLNSSSGKWRISCGLLICLILVTLLQTLSRASYVAFVFMYLFLITLTKKQKTLAIVLLILGILIVPVIMPRITAGVRERVEYTFARGRTYRPLGKQVRLEDSAAQRVESWNRVFGQWTRRPFFGYGVTGVGLVDAQYPRVLGETGILGFFAFIWLLVVIFRYAVFVNKNADDEWMRGLTLGFLIAYIGVLIHSFAANTFIIVRIMEPFWFLAAIIVSIPHLSPLEKVEPQTKER